MHLVDYSKELSDLHNELLVLLNSASVEYEYPQFIGAGHKPHVTAREGRYFAAGDVLTSNHAYLVEVIEGQSNSLEVCTSRIRMHL